MNRNNRITIVVVLVLAVGSVLAWKQRERMSTQPAEPRSPTGNRPVSKLSTTIPASRPLPRLVDLGAGRCVACKMMAPILDELKREYAGRLNVEFIDVWENPGVAGRYNVTAIPTQILYDADGKELFRHVGFFSKKDILEKCSELGFNLDNDVGRNADTPGAPG